MQHHIKVYFKFMLEILKHFDKFKQVIKKVENSLPFGKDGLPAWPVFWQLVPGQTQQDFSVEMAFKYSFLSPLWQGRLNSL